MEVEPQKTTRRSSLRLLHTADVHIGDDTTQTSPDRRISGLARVVDIAIEQRIDALLIAGDFFDNARVKASQIDAAWNELSRLSVPVLLTPGNHDCLGVPSIYQKVSPPESLSQIIFLGDPNGSHAVLANLGLTVWARGLVNHEPSHYPLNGYDGRINEDWHVVMAHGHFIKDGQVIDRSSPIPEKQIAELDCDYLALGHWHIFTDVSTSGTRAFYSGSPSDSFSAYSSVNLVILEPESAPVVERVAINE
jgi:exonuclease SbcD